MGIVPNAAKKPLQAAIQGQVVPLTASSSPEKGDEASQS